MKSYDAVLWCSLLIDQYNAILQHYLLRDAYLLSNCVKSPSSWAGKKMKQDPLLTQLPHLLPEEVPTSLLDRQENVYVALVLTWIWLRTQLFLPSEAIEKKERWPFEGFSLKRMEDVRLRKGWSYIYLKYFKF